MLGRAVSGANWVEVDFSGADLSDAVLDKTVHDASTKWPESFPPWSADGTHDRQPRRAPSTG